MSYFHLKKLHLSFFPHSLQSLEADMEAWSAKVKAEEDDLTSLEVIRGPLPPVRGSARAGQSRRRWSGGNEEDGERKGEKGVLKNLWGVGMWWMERGGGEEQVKRERTERKSKCDKKKGRKLWTIRLEKGKGKKKDIQIGNPCKWESGRRKYWETKKKERNV